MIQIGIIEPQYRLAEVIKEKVELSPDFSAEVLLGLDPTKLPNCEQCDLLLADLRFVFDLDLNVRDEWLQDRPFLLMSSFVDAWSQMDAYRLGAKGLVSKAHPPELLHRSMFQSLEGGMDLTHPVRRELKGLSALPEWISQFNQREQGLLRMIVKGQSIEKAALELKLKKEEIHALLRSIFSNVHLTKS